MDALGLTFVLAVLAIWMVVSFVVAMGLGRLLRRSARVQQAERSELEGPFSELRAQSELRRGRAEWAQRERWRRGL